MTTSSIDVTQHPLYDIANEYQRQALRTEPNPPPVFVAEGDTVRLSRLLHAALGICTESGELQDQIKKHLIYGRPLDATNLVEECGDVLWYVALALDAIGVTMTDCMARNIEKLRARFPQRFTQAQANERNLDAERMALESAKPSEDYLRGRRDAIRDVISYFVFDVRTRFLESEPECHFIERHCKVIEEYTAIKPDGRGIVWDTNAPQPKTP